MKGRAPLTAAAVLAFGSPFLAGSLAARQAPPFDSRPVALAQGGQGAGRGDGVQVGVPEGRPGGAGRGGGRGRQTGPARPAPRGADGRVLLGGATPAEKGLWLPGPVVANQLGPNDQVPMQPWARALFADRLTHRLEPHARCKASGAARQFLTPYGVEIVELKELQRIYIFDVGGPHTWRTIYMDGRTHPTQLTPTYYGHSIGWWEGDTLVIDTRGYNEGFWFDRDGLPHTEQLHTVEKLTRLDSATMRYELTIEDPNVYTTRWTGGMNLRWENNIELFEYVCQEANYAHELMVGTLRSVDRTSPVVP